MKTRMNNEVKVRRSTQSLVLGKAKAMSFEDIEVARAARTQSQKWRVLRERPLMARENVVGSVRLLRKRQMNQRQMSQS